MDNVKLYLPRFKQERRLLRSEDTGYQTYYAFPALKRVGDRALVTVKSGQKHWGDAEAALTQLTLDIPGQQMLSRFRRVTQHGGSESLFRRGRFH